MMRQDTDFVAYALIFFPTPVIDQIPNICLYAMSLERFPDPIMGQVIETCLYSIRLSIHLTPVMRQITNARLCSAGLRRLLDANNVSEYQCLLVSHRS